MVEGKEGGGGGGRGGGGGNRSYHHLISLLHWASRSRASRDVNNDNSRYSRAGDNSFGWGGSWSSKEGRT